MKKTTSKIKIWTEEEDKVFIETINDLVGLQSLTLNKAIDRVAEKLNRSKSGCAFRYNKIIKEQLDSTLLEKISANNPANSGKEHSTYVIKNQLSIDISDAPDVNDFSKVNSLKKELQTIESKIKELEIRKKMIVDELQVYLDSIASLIRSTS